MDYGIDNNIVQIVMASLGFVAFVIGMFSWVMVSWLRGRRRSNAPWTGNDREDIPPLFAKLVERVMRERDAEQARLQARVETLEKIVIDTHRQQTRNDTGNRTER